MWETEDKKGVPDCLAGARSMVRALDISESSELLESRDSRAEKHTCQLARRLRATERQ